MNAYSRPGRGFTLIELLTVLVIITILLGIASTLYVIARRTTLERKAQAEIERLGNILGDYMLDNGAFPADIGIAEMVRRLPESFTVDTSRSPPIIDPWGEPYVYSRDSTYAYSLLSKGADKMAGTDDDVE